MADGLGEGGGGQAGVVFDVQHDQGLGGPGEIGADHFFQLAGAGPVQVIHPEAVGRHRSEALPVVVPDEEQPGFDPEKVQHRLQGQVGNLLEVLGVGRDRGNFIEQADFPGACRGCGGRGWGQWLDGPPVWT